MTKTATTSLHGNIYQVDPLLAGRRVELVFDPFDLTTLQVRLAALPAGTAIPRHIDRHAHPKARPATPPSPPPATGIDYAGLLDAAHQAELAQKVNHAALANPSPTTQPAEHDLDQPDLPLPPPTGSYSHDRSVAGVLRVHPHPLRSRPGTRDAAPADASHGKAVARISWCVAEHRIGVITGEVGTGKTIAVRAAISALDPTRHNIIYLPNPTVNIRGIHHQIVLTSGGRPLTHHTTLVPQTTDLLATEQVERGHTPVLMIDEAPLLDHAQLEAIRMLTNHDLDSPSPFACLLIGQPTLRRRMKPGALAALDQRIGLRYTMPPMSPEETTSYLRHHLTLAGRNDTLFSDDATALIHQTNPGYPRAINNIAVQALIATFATDKAIIDEKSARTTIAEVTAE